MIKIQGRSYTNEFIFCYGCNKKAIWLRGIHDMHGKYVPYCSKCIKDGKSNWELQDNREMKE